MDVEQIVRENISKTIHMSLATCIDNKPWVCEVHFAYDDNLNLYFISKESRRHSQEIAINANVSGDIVKQHQPGDSVIGVYFEGLAEKLDNVGVDHPAFKALHSQQGLSESAIEDAKKSDGHRFYRITVSKWYAFGKFGADHGRKLSLDWNK